MSKLIPRSFSFIVGRQPVTMQFIPEHASRTSVRTTWVLKRRHELPVQDPIQKLLHPEKKRYVPEKNKIFDIIEDTTVTSKNPPPIKLLLVKDVGGHGRAGDIVTVERTFARMTLLPERKAVYITEMALKAMEEKRRNNSLHKWSSPFAAEILEEFSNRVQLVQMSSESPWKLEKWHVRSAMRRAGIWCPEAAIELPSQEITGPTPEMHGKCFSVFITINGKERGHMLCQMELLSKDPNNPFPELPSDPQQPKPTNPVALFEGAIAPENYMEKKTDDDDLDEIFF